MTRAAVARLLAALLAALLLSGCADEQEKYCDAVQDKQAELGRGPGRRHARTRC